MIFQFNITAVMKHVLIRINRKTVCDKHIFYLYYTLNTLYLIVRKCILTFKESINTPKHHNMSSYFHLYLSSHSLIPIFCISFSKLTTRFLGLPQHFSLSESGYKNLNFYLLHHSLAHLILLCIISMTISGSLY